MTTIKRALATRGGGVQLELASIHRNAIETIDRETNAAPHERCERAVTNLESDYLVYLPIELPWRRPTSPVVLLATAIEDNAIFISRLRVIYIMTGGVRGRDLPR